MYVCMSKVTPHLGLLWTLTVEHLQTTDKSVYGRHWTHIGVFLKNDKHAPGQGALRKETSLQLQ